MLPPAHGSFSGHRRPAAAALIVVDQLSTSPQRVETGQEIIMMRPGAAVQDHRRRAIADPTFEDADAANLPVARLRLLLHSPPGIEGSTQRLSSQQNRQRI